jgi:hypothetical protein
MTNIVTLAKESGAWVLRSPSGSVIQTPNTQTDGLQEAVDYSVANMVGLRVVGTVDDVIACEVGIVMPSVEGIAWRVDPVTIEFDSGVQLGLDFDTMYHCDIEWLATQKFSGTSGAAVRFYPRTSLNGTTAWKHNRLIMLRAALFEGGAYSHGAQFNPTQGEISTNYIDLGEIEGGHSGNVSYMGDGINVLKPQNGLSFVENEVRAMVSHISGAGARIGDDGSTINGYLLANRWRLNMQAPVGTSAAAISTWETNGLYEMSIRGGFNTGMQFQNGAVENVCVVLRNDAISKYGGGWQQNHLLGN